MRCTKVTMTELELALSKLEGVKKIGDGYQARCPCHDDKHQSLSVAEKDGKIMLYCHAGCSFNNIIKALGLLPDRTSDIPIITNTYNYTDAEGKLLYQVVRYRPKSFRQRRPDGNDWIWNLDGITPTLYHLPEVLQAIKNHNIVWIVEGEKDADNLRKVGQAATTINGGASSKWPPSLVPQFIEATVAIIPDSDEPGRKYAQYVGNLLYGWCSSLKIVNLPSKDVSDYLESKTIDNLLNIYHNSGEYIPSGVITRDEFNSWRGINQYLWQLLLWRKKSRNRVYNDYK